MITYSSTVNGDVNELKLAGRLDVKAAKEAEVAFAEAAETSQNVALDLSGTALANRKASLRVDNGVLILNVVPAGLILTFK